MSVGVILCMHGNLATELLNTAEMIAGKSKDIIPINFAMDDSADRLLDDYKDIIETFNKDEILFLVDVYGGSPFNVANKLALINDNYAVVTGVNVSMMIETIEKKDSGDLGFLIDNILKRGKKSISNSKDVMKLDLE